MLAWLRDLVADWDERIARGPHALRLARWPLVRGLARRRSAALFDLCAGFVYAQVLAACVRLRVFEILGEGAISAEALAGRIAVPEAATTRLLAAACALRLVRRRRDGRYRLGPLGAAVAADPGIAAMVAHGAAFYRDLADPVALLRGEGASRTLAGLWPYAGAPDPAALPASELAGYTRVMAASQAMVARQVLATVDLTRFRRLLDVGGGDGAFLRAAGRAAPHLHLGLFDLPGVVADAQAAFTAAGMGDRATVTGGDFRRDPLPTGADILSLVRVLHDHDDEVASGLLRACRGAQATGDTLLVAEPLAGSRGSERVGDAYFGFYLLAFGQGRTRTAGELRTLLHGAGYGSVEIRTPDLPIITGIVLARAT